MVINIKLVQIHDFKLNELPVLTKLLTLASLQGIADLLKGEGIGFNEFEMKLHYPLKYNKSLNHNYSNIRNFSSYENEVDEMGGNANSFSDNCIRIDSSIDSIIDLMQRL